MPRFWPGFLAVWAAVILHVTWVAVLLIPDTHAFFATPVHVVYALAGYSAWRTAALLAIVAAAALAGLVHHVTPGQKILYLLPQQLVLGISAAGALIAILHSHYADGVARPGTFIAADQAAVIVTWAGHTCAIMFLYLIHTGKITFGGKRIPTEDA